MRSDVHGRMRKQIFTTINNNIHVNVIVSRFDLFCSFPSCYRESKEPLNCGRRRAKNISLRNLQSMIDGTSGEIRSDEAFEENISIQTTASPLNGSKLNQIVGK